MKLLLLLPFILLAQIAPAQTGKHIKVPGTKCSLVPPAGFVAATTFSGFQNEETGASIMVNELPAPYPELADGFTAEALASRGMMMLNKETIDFNGTKATFISLSQPANGTTYLKQMLIFGDDKHTVMINGIYPEASKNLEAGIRAALLSTVYNNAQKEDPLEAAAFTVDTRDTDFKLIKYMAGSLLYSTDGKMPTDKPTLIVGNSVAKVSATDLKKYAEERFKKLPGGEHAVIKTTNEITVDDLKGYEIVADSKTKAGVPQLAYQVMLFTESGGYYIIIGHAAEDLDKYLDSYKKIARTFRRK